MQTMVNADELTAYLDEKRRMVAQALDASLPPAETLPARLHDAMRYSALAGGKRLRPVMLLMTAELFGKPCAEVAFAAAALECVHTYSLIHDDLPAMDNDDLRRGRPTNHKVYGEALAILAGDALLTLAFEIMTDPRHAAACAPSSILRAAHELASAAGSTGMAGGQTLDIQAEHRQISLAELETIHRLKTGKMIIAAMRIGAILANAAPDGLAAVTRYGECVGLAFQIVDDMLDIEGTAAELGKSPAKDLQQEKATYPALYGMAASKALVKDMVAHAIKSVAMFGERAEYLRQLAELMGARTH